MTNTTKDFAGAIRAKLTADPRLEEEVKQEAFHADIAEAIYRCRKEAGLTQAKLASRAGTTQSVIARIESADYEGHSLALLRRIAAALDRSLSIGLQRKTDVEGTAVVVSTEIASSPGEHRADEQPVTAP